MIIHVHVYTCILEYIYTNRHIVYNRHVVLLLWYLHVSAVWLFTLAQLAVLGRKTQYMFIRMYVFTPCYRIKPGKLEPKEPLNGSCSKGSQISTYRERSLNLLEN